MSNHKTRAGETGFKLTGWTDFTIFPVPARKRELPQLPDASGMHPQEAASCHHSQYAPGHQLHTRQAGGEQDVRGESDAPLSSGGFQWGWGREFDTNTSDRKAPNKNFQEEKLISEIRNADCNAFSPPPEKEKERKKRNHVGERPGFKETKSDVCTNRF